MFALPTMAISISDDAQQQFDEVSVLLSIYNDERVIPISKNSNVECSYDPNTLTRSSCKVFSGVSLSVNPKLATENSALDIMVGDAENIRSAGKVKYLPPVLLHVTFRDTYPSKDPPLYRICAWYLSGCRS